MRKRKISRNRGIIIGLSILFAVIYFSYAFYLRFSMREKYNHAIEEYTNGDYQKASEEFKAIINYQDSKDYYEKANIFIATSDSNEGWGAVVNEAMNTGCAIVANRRMGSVPILIGENDTGFMYDSYNDLENKVKRLIEDKELRKKLGKNAYNYITTEWTAELAAERIINLLWNIVLILEYYLKSMS